MVGLFISLVLISGVEQKLFEFKGKLLQDTVYQMINPVLRTVLRNISGSTLYISRVNWHFHVFNERGEELHKNYVEEYTILKGVPANWKAFPPGDSFVTFHGYFLDERSGTLGVDPGVYRLVVEASVGVKGIGKVELPTIEDTFVVIPPEGKEREAFDFLKKFYSPHLGHSLVISQRLLRDALRRAKPKKYKASRIIMEEHIKYYEEFLKRFPNSIYAEVVLNQYYILHKLTYLNIPEEKRKEVVRRLLTCSPYSPEVPDAINYIIKNGWTDLYGLIRKVAQEHPNSAVSWAYQRHKEELEKE